MSCAEIDLGPEAVPTRASRKVSRPARAAVVRRPARRKVPPLAWVLAASAACWCLLFMAVPPTAQDFPLIDDWAFARSAVAFAHGVDIHYLGWASMPQLGQWLWAAPFVWAGGGSLVTLRLSTVFLSWGGLWAFYDLLRGERLGAGPAAFLTAVLAFNPFFFLLQGTFMTDVPALSFALLTLALYRRALVGGRLGTLIAATTVALLAVTTRQNAVAAPAAAAVLLGRSAYRRRPLWLAGAGLPLAAAVVVNQWLMGRADVVRLTPAVPHPTTLLFLPLVVLVFVGLAAMPVLALGRVPVTWRAFGKPAVVLGGAALYACYWSGGSSDFGGLFPYAASMFVHLQAVPDLTVVGDAVLPFGDGIRGVLTVLGCLAAAGLIGQLDRPRRGDWRRSPLLVFTTAQAALLLVSPKLLDRYLLPLLPGALFLAAPRLPTDRLAWKPALAALAASVVLSLVVMHDWLSWNAARWALGRRAVAAGVSPWDIEGGFEWDGWFAPADRQPPTRPTVNPFPLGFTADCPFSRHVRGTFALALSPPEGAECLDAEPYTLWLTPAHRDCYLVRKAPRPERRAMSDER